MAPMKNGDQAHFKPHTSLAVKRGNLATPSFTAEEETSQKGKEKKKKIRGEKMYECIYTLIHSIVPREIQLVKITIIKRKLGKLSWG